MLLIHVSSYDLFGQLAILNHTSKVHRKWEWSGITVDGDFALLHYRSSYTIVPSIYTAYTYYTRYS